MVLATHMEAVQQLKESLKELHDLKAARGEFGIVFITAPTQFHFPHRTIQRRIHD
jgi:hypothetical protein